MHGCVIVFRFVEMLICVCLFCFKNDIVTFVTFKAYFKFLKQLLNDLILWHILRRVSGTFRAGVCVYVILSCT